MTFYCRAIKRRVRGGAVHLFGLTVTPGASFTVAKLIPRLAMDHPEPPWTIPARPGRIAINNSFAVSKLADDALGALIHKVRRISTHQVRRAPHQLQHEEATGKGYGTRHTFQDCLERSVMVCPRQSNFCPALGPWPILGPGPDPRPRSRPGTKAPGPTGIAS